LQSDICKEEGSGMEKTAIDVSEKTKTNSPRRSMKADFEERLQIILDTIFENVDKECLRKIYLFGSYAYGRPNRDSDIDLCIVFADEVDITETYMKFAIPLFNKGLTSIDKLVYHESEFNEKKAKKGIVNTITTRGRLLYG
jgi:predicted nucleotidyltransferase